MSEKGSRAVGSPAAILRRTHRRGPSNVSLGSELRSSDAQPTSLNINRALDELTTLFLGYSHVENDDEDNDDSNASEVVDDRSVSSLSRPSGGDHFAPIAAAPSPYKPPPHSSAGAAAGAAASIGLGSAAGPPHGNEGVQSQYGGAAESDEIFIVGEDLLLYSMAIRGIIQPLVGRRMPNLEPGLGVSIHYKTSQQETGGFFDLALGGVSGTSFGAYVKSAVHERCQLLVELRALSKIACSLFMDEEMTELIWDRESVMSHIDSVPEKYRPALELVVDVALSDGELLLFLQSMHRCRMAVVCEGQRRMSIVLSASETDAVRLLSAVFAQVVHSALIETSPATDPPKSADAFGDLLQSTASKNRKRTLSTSSAEVQFNIRNQQIQRCVRTLENRFELILHSLLTLKVEHKPPPVSKRRRRAVSVSGKMRITGEQIFIPLRKRSLSAPPLPEYTMFSPINADVTTINCNGNVQESSVEVIAEALLSRVRTSFGLAVNNQQHLFVLHRELISCGDDVRNLVRDFRGSIGAVLAGDVSAMAVERANLSEFVKSTLRQIHCLELIPIDVGRLLKGAVNLCADPRLGFTGSIKVNVLDGRPPERSESPTMIHESAMHDLGSSADLSLLKLSTHQESSNTPTWRNQEWGGAGSFVIDIAYPTTVLQLQLWNDDSLFTVPFLTVPFDSLAARVHPDDRVGTVLVDLTEHLPSKTADWTDSPADWDTVGWFDIMMKHRHVGRVKLSLSFEWTRYPSRIFVPDHAVLYRKLARLLVMSELNEYEATEDDGDFADLDGDGEQSGVDDDRQLPMALEDLSQPFTGLYPGYLSLFSLCILNEYATRYSVPLISQRIAILSSLADGFTKKGVIDTRILHLAINEVEHVLHRGHPLGSDDGHLYVATMLALAQCLLDQLTKYKDFFLSSGVDGALGATVVCLRAIISTRTFQQMHPNYPSLSELVTKCIRQGAVDMYRRLIAMSAPSEAGLEHRAVISTSANLFKASRLVELVSEEMDRDTVFFGGLYAIGLDNELSHVTTLVYLELMSEDLDKMFQHIIVEVSTEIFDLYFKLREIRHRLRRVLSAENFNSIQQFLPLTDWFVSFVFKWLDSVDTKMNQWVDLVLSNDDLRIAKNAKELHSSSVGDLFDMMQQNLEFLSSLVWEDSRTEAIFKTKMAQTVSRVVRSYVHGLRLIADRRLSRASLADLLAKWQVSYVPLTPNDQLFQFVPIAEPLVCITNMLAARRRLEDVCRFIGVNKVMDELDEIYSGPSRPRTISVLQSQTSDDTTVEYITRQRRSIGVGPQLNDTIGSATSPVLPRGFVDRRSKTSGNLYSTPPTDSTSAAGASLSSIGGTGSQPPLVQHRSSGAGRSLSRGSVTSNTTGTGGQPLMSVAERSSSTLEGNAYSTASIRTREPLIMEAFDEAFVVLDEVRMDLIVNYSKLLVRGICLNILCTIGICPAAAASQDRDIKKRMFSSSNAKRKSAMALDDSATYPMDESTFALLKSYVTDSLKYVQKYLHADSFNKLLRFVWRGVNEAARELAAPCGSTQLRLISRILPFLHELFNVIGKGLDLSFLETSTGEYAEARNAIDQSIKGRYEAK